MNEFDTKTKVELAIVAVLTLVAVLMKELKLLDEHITQTFGLAAVTFIGLIALLNLYRWFKNIESYSNDEK